jgi:2'-5' RNA ligase
MPRLFVAVDLPAAAATKLVTLQPSPSAGIRLVTPGQMHLTLHYLGDADIERMAAALRTVAVPAFSLVFEGVGQFPSAGGATTLWAGIRESAELLRLHAAVATALAGEGYQSESRRYMPHVTLARCGPEVPTSQVDEFLARHAAFSMSAGPVAGFGLYSSTFAGDAPLYRCERSFRLDTE